MPNRTNLIQELRNYRRLLISMILRASGLADDLKALQTEVDAALTRLETEEKEK